ncbi:MAG: FHA domain-containing protein [Gemmatimonadetes bacterium]|nr:FHA domain-containing protein [Gemmatimonadota bacterium]
MELILEVERAGGAKSWHALGETPLTIGRGLRNAVILEDPYVDAQHLQVVHGDDGSWCIEDVGSSNGVWLGAQRLAGRLALHPGQEFRAGRTIIRVRDRDEPVAAALPDRPVAVPVAEAAVVPHEPVLAPRLGARRGGPVAAAAIAAITVFSWSTSTARTVGSELFASASASWLFLAVWAGIWAILGRIISQRFFYQGHLVIASVASLVALALVTLSGWVTFLFPGSVVWDGVMTAGAIAFVAATVTAHLGLATHIRRERLVRTAVTMCATMLTLLGVSALLDDDRFSDVPSIVSVLKPLRPGLVPAISVAEFGEAIAGLREEADELAKKGELPPTGLDLE